MIYVDAYLGVGGFISGAVKSVRLSLLKLITKHANYDKIAFVRSKVDFSMDESASSRDWWGAIKAALRFGCRQALRFLRGLRVPRRQRPEGSAAQSPAEIARIIFHHFADIEAAEVLDMDELYTVHHGRPDFGAHAQLSRDCVTTKPELRRLCSTVQAHKAPGPDGLIPDLFKVDPDATADILHPFFLKMATLREEPLMSNGTISTDLFNGVASYLLMPKYRAISFGPTIPQIHHRLLRSRLLVLAHSLFKDTQFGGREGGSCEMPILPSRKFSKVAKKLGSAAVLTFFDIASAYYSAVRSLISWHLELPGDDAHHGISSDVAKYVGRGHTKHYTPRRCPRWLG